MYTNFLHRHNQPNLNVSIVLQKLFINKFHVKSVLKLSVKCTSLLDILKKVRFIVFRRVTCFGISPIPHSLQHVSVTPHNEDNIFVISLRLLAYTVATVEQAYPPMTHFLSPTIVCGRGAIAADR